VKGEEDKTVTAGSVVTVTVRLERQNLAANISESLALAAVDEYDDEADEDKEEDGDEEEEESQVGVWGGTRAGVAVDLFFWSILPCLTFRTV